MLRGRPRRRARSGAGRCGGLESGRPHLLAAGNVTTGTGWPQTLTGRSGPARPRLACHTQVGDPYGHVYHTDACGCEIFVGLWFMSKLGSAMQLATAPPVTRSRFMKLVILQVLTATAPGDTLSQLRGLMGSHPICKFCAITVLLRPMLSLDLMRYQVGMRWSRSPTELVAESFYRQAPGRLVLVTITLLVR